MSSCFISVIVIAYNIQDVIGECLDSAFAQAYDNYEVIVVNDGSTDNTLSVIEEKCGHGNRATIVNKDNGGIMSARKAGVKAAKGEYLVFVDGDDWINKDMLSNLVNEIPVGEAPDIVMTRHYVQKASGDIFVTADESECLHGYAKDGYFLNTALGKLDHHWFPKLYRREFVIRAGCMDFPDISMGDDLLANIIFGCFNPHMVYGASVNYYYRYYANSIIRYDSKKKLEQIRTLETIEETLQENGYLDKYPDILKGQWLTYCEAYLISPRISLSVKKEIISRCRDKLTGIENSSLYDNRTKGFYRKCNLWLLQNAPYSLTGTAVMILFYLNRFFSKL